MKLLFAFGTRPEGIKLAPVILEARRREGIESLVVSTGQHREMLEAVLTLFAIKPDVDLALMQPGQTLPALTARAMAAFAPLLQREKPDAVVVQGDTTTAMVCALAAFYERIPVAHVEAGLRTDRRDAPFPEEVNRRLIGQLANWHFAPTEGSRQNLLRDGVQHLGGKIIVTGNTVIDALLLAVDAVKKNPPAHDDLRAALDWKSRPGACVILVTGHRRENFGEPFREFCLGLRDIATAHPEALIVYPVHLNPQVQAPVRELLAGVANIRLAPVVDYPVFVALMQAADLIITDSGGVQEEAPALGKPVLVTRDVTERPEAVQAGGVKLVGPHRQALFDAADLLLRDPKAYAEMAKARSPYGDGHAAARCIDALLTKEDSNDEDLRT
ncbi:UDP-N-acetylglucosamine 2-epimerase (non-hydrolyzing) [soil metagenome]